MPSQLALVICIITIFYLFWRDRKSSEGVSRALWIPFIWMFLAGSRFASQWFNFNSPDFSSDSILEGSPVDRFIFTVLIVAGIIIIFRRGLDWRKIFIQNMWIWLFFIFGAISFFWSDYPFVSFKRWIKALGNIVMVLVILSEEKPYLALGVILRRLAYILLPLSVLFIKYYPDLGRAYHMGRPMFTGVTFQKNQLGQLCLITGTYFSWLLLIGQKMKYAVSRKLHYSIYLIIVPILGWLLLKANSSTSIACLIAALGIFAMSRLGIFRENPRRILYFSISAIFCFFILEYFFEVKNYIIALLGRSSDLTTRVPMWADLRSMVKNPFLGFGFESFWLGERRRIVSEAWGISSQAHNGYLDMYLHLGIVGLFFIVAWIMSGLRKVHRSLKGNYPAGVLRFSLIVVVALYNYTEATFYGVSNMWIIFLIGVISIPYHYASSTPKEYKTRI